MLLKYTWYEIICNNLMLLFQDFESQIAVFFFTAKLHGIKSTKATIPYTSKARNKRPGHVIYRARRSRHASRCPEACLQKRWGKVRLWRRLQHLLGLPWLQFLKDIYFERHDNRQTRQRDISPTAFYKARIRIVVDRARCRRWAFWRAGILQLWLPAVSAPLYRAQGLVGRRLEELVRNR